MNEGNPSLATRVEDTAAALRAEAMRSADASAAVFVLEGVEVAGDEARLRYALELEPGGAGGGGASRRLAFVERIEVPGLGSAAAETGERGRRVGACLRLLHAMAGVSYFKLCCPRVIAAPGGLDAGLAALVGEVYRRGLAEYGHRNGVSMAGRAVVRAEDVRDEDVRDEDVPVGAGRDGGGGEGGGGVPGRRCLVPFGGGKDSYVTLWALRAAGANVVPFVLATGTGAMGVTEQLAAAAGLRPVVARRTLDKRMVALHRAGAPNGHVPVTAVVGAAALLTAAVLGVDDVVMSNERSANRGTAIGDEDVNHQYSKSLACERATAGWLARAAPGMRCFSMLRGLSELSIARAFASGAVREGRLVTPFVSCNANFRQGRGGRGWSWCLDCPKCRFVHLALAPFVEPGALAEALGGDPLADGAAVERYAELLELPGRARPFECVAGGDEVAAALWLLTQHDAWRGHAVVRWFAETARAGLGDGQSLGDGAGLVSAALTPSAEHLVPGAYAGAVRRAAEGSLGGALGGVGTGAGVGDAE